MKIQLPNLVISLALIALISACSDNDNDEDSPVPDQSVGFESFTWTSLAASPRWEPRAGLQAVDFQDRLYVMGGRTPKEPMQPPIPGDSDIWNDVWTSDDLGSTWEQQLISDRTNHWPARAYFQSVVAQNHIYVLGGQNFRVEENLDCAGAPPEFCPPFVSVSDFFNDVWRSADGVNWEQMTANAEWPARAGLSSVVLNDEIYVLGGSINDDAAIVSGPAARIYYNDVWKSTDGVQWEQLTESAPWAPRAGAVTVVKDGYLYLLGGEDGFTCEPLPTCEPPYYNDVWRSSDGAQWELVTEAAEWVARPGHQCAVILEKFLCFGGFGLVQNPVDMWESDDGVTWTQLAQSPWDAASPDDIKYDFDVLVTKSGPDSEQMAVYTFGGDRETFDFSDPTNYLRIDNDVWRFSE